MPGPVSESLGLRLLAVVALVLANAFFVAAEFALVAARRTRIEAMVRRGDRKARWVAAPLMSFSWITRPLTGLLNWRAGRVGRLLGLKGSAAELEQIHSPEGLRVLGEQGRKRGKLDADDARLLQGVFEFSEMSAR